MAVKAWHETTSPVTDANQLGIIGPDDWNAAHPILSDEAIDAGYVIIHDGSDFVARPLSLTDIAGSVSDTGIVVQTGSGLLTRTILGTANEIVVANPDGVDANPILSLSPTLVLPGTLALGGDVDADGYSLTDLLNLAFADGGCIQTAPTEGSILNIQAWSVGESAGYSNVITVLSGGATPQLILANPTLAGTASITFNSTGLIRGNGGNGATLIFQAFDTDDGVYRDFVTLTGGATPSIAIAAPTGGSGTLNNIVIGGTTPLAGTFTTIAANAATFTTILANDDITLANGKALKTNTTTAHTALIQAYDVDNTTYRTFGTLTNGNTPSFALAAPSGGSLTINGAVIGGVAAAAATFTTIAATDDITVSTGKAIKTASSAGNTLLFKARDVDGAADTTFITLTANNTPSIAISAPAGSSGTINNIVIGGTTAAAATFTTISATDDITVSTGKAIKSATSAGNTVLFKARDVDGASDTTFITLTANNTPSIAISAPAGSSGTMDNIVIGGTTRANGSFGLISAGIGVVSGYACSLQAPDANGQVLRLFDNSGNAQWHVKLQGSGFSDLGFSETGIQDNRFVIATNGNIGIGGTSFGGGTNTIFIANAALSPSTNPTGGGDLYVESGTLKYRGPSGTVTPLAVP